MFIGCLYIVLGGVILYFAGDFLVKGAGSFAIRKGISQFLVGLTIVALGTSAPEFFVSFIAALKGSSSISIGNIIGSNIANTSLVLGAALLIFEKKKKLSVNISEVMFFILASFLLFLFSFLGHIGRVEGVLFIILLASCLCLSFIKHSKIISTEDFGVIKNKKLEILFITLGIIGLPLGAKIFVEGGVLFARTIGISELLIGATIMALGTSLPELATSIVAAIKKNPGMSIGNVVGSNIFNIAGVMGIIGIIHPISVDKNVLTLDLPIMCILSILTYLFITRKSIKHIYGLILLLIYVFYIICNIYRG
jgi:cation:H+ antiporter